MSSNKGYDHLKIHEGLSLDVYDTIARTAQQLGIPFAGHVSNYVGLRHALNSGQHTVDHLDNYVEALIENSESTVSQATITSAELVADVSESLIPVIVNETVKAGTAVVPTMALWEHFLGNVSGLALQQSTVGLAYMPQSTVSDWSRRIGNSGYSPANKKIMALRRQILHALSQGGVSSNMK